MVRFTRTAVAAIGMFPEAIEFAKEISAYMRANFGTNTKVFADTEGSIYWITDYADFSEFGRIRAAVTSDEGYWARIKKAQDLFLDGSVQDTVITSVD